MVYLKPTKVPKFVEEEGGEVKEVRVKLVVATPQNCPE